jgi:hypothetical protein
MERKKHQVERSGTVGGDIEALPASEKADTYVVLKKRHDEKETENSDVNDSSSSGKE